MCLKICNLTSLPSFLTFFQLHHNQSSTLHHISFFPKNILFVIRIIIHFHYTYITRNVVHVSTINLGEGLNDGVQVFPISLHLVLCEVPVHWSVGYVPRYEYHVDILSALLHPAFELGDPVGGVVNISGVYWIRGRRKRKKEKEAVLFFGFLVYICDIY